MLLLALLLQKWTAFLINKSNLHTPGKKRSLPATLVGQMPDIYIIVCLLAYPHLSLGPLFHFVSANQLLGWNGGPDRELQLLEGSRSYEFPHLGFHSKSGVPCHG